MVFTDIRLQNYRSYIDSSFEIGKGVTIVVGPNAIGKSNLIEAILLAANGSSYRGKSGLVNHNSDWARIDIHADDNSVRTVKIRLSSQKDTLDKEHIVSGKTYKRLPVEYRHPAVLFEPNNLFLIHAEPVNRREYIDNLASTLSPEFSRISQKYKRTLAQRNALLKLPRLDKTQMFIWNLKLIELAGQIIKNRLKVADLVNEKISKTYSDIANKRSVLKIIYKTSIGTDNYSNNLLKKLETDLEIDRARGFTGSGPHRDDIEVFLNQQPASAWASRGEIRTLVLALKIIEMNLIEEKTQIRPLLLLDDVFSELDGARRKALTGFLRKYQTIITTTDADAVMKNFASDYSLIAFSKPAKITNKARI